MQTAARQRSKAMPPGRETAIGIRAARPEEIRAAVPASLLGMPVEVSAHPRSQIRYWLDRVSADRKCPQVEVPCSARGTPARIFALGCNESDFDCDAAVTEGRKTNVESIADFQRFHQILAKIEVNPDVGQIDQRDERHARRHIFARLHVTLIHL